MALCIALLPASWAIAGVYLALNLRGALNRGKVWRQFALMMVFPVAGPVWLGLSELLGRVYFSRRKDLVAKRPKEAVSATFALPDTANELNVVSIEEAMIVSHKSDLRKLLLNLLKDGADNSLGAISLALDSEDSEASHYSASAIADSLARFHEKVRLLSEQLESNENDVDALSSLIEYLLWYLSKNVLSDREQKMYLKKTSDELTRLTALAPSDVSSAFFSQLTELCVRADETELATHWARRCAELFPDCLDAYSANLRACFAVGDDVGFRRWLNALKQSKIVVNKELLDIIHTFS